MRKTQCCVSVLTLLHMFVSIIINTVQRPATPPMRASDGPGRIRKMNNNSQRKNQLTNFAEAVWVAPARAFDAAPALGPTGAALARFAGALVAPVAGIYRRRRLHEELMALDDRLLADIGVGRADIGHIVDDAFRDHAADRHGAAARAAQLITLHGRWTGFRPETRAARGRHGCSSVAAACPEKTPCRPRSFPCSRPGP